MTASETGPTGSVRRKRVLVCAASYADARDAMRIAERLARLVGIDLGGLFLEDPEATELAASPHQRIVTASGMLVLAPGRRQMQLVMSGEARAFRAELSRIAERHALRWSFERISGEPVRCLCRAAQSWDMLLIGHRRLLDRRGPVLVLRPAGAPSAADDSELSELASRLASALGSYVQQIAPAGDSPADTEALLDRIGRLHAALVLTDATDGPFCTGSGLRRLVEAARCPVLVTGASALRGAMEHDTPIPPGPPGPPPG